MKKLILFLMLCIISIGINAQNMEKRDTSKVQAYVKKINHKSKNFLSVITYSSTTDEYGSPFYNKKSIYFFKTHTKKPREIKKIYSEYEYFDDNNATMQESIIIKSNEFIYFVVDYYEGGGLVTQVEVYIIYKKSGDLEFYFTKDGDDFPDDSDFKQALYEHIQEAIKEYNETFAK